MIADNFEYDGMLASDFGLIVCNIDSSSSDGTFSAGSEINFNQVAVNNGSLFLSSAVTYDTALESTFRVCKFNCKDGITPLTIDDRRKISRWLNRKEPHILKVIDENDPDTCDYMYEGSFIGLSEIYIGGYCVGYELHFLSNRPFAIGKTVKKHINATTSDFEYILNDVSDEVGYIYPKLTVKCNSEGNLNITNYNEDERLGRITQVKNCSPGEVLTFSNNLILSTSLDSHKSNLQNDFNYCFFRISNSYDNRTNKIKVSIPCEIDIEYNPVVKGVGL